MAVSAANSMKPVMERSNTAMSRLQSGVALCTVSLLLCIFSMGCDLRYGVVDAIFQLAPDSRLPRWFDISSYSRNDLTMEMTYYSSPFGFKVKMVVYGPAPERKALMKKVGTIRWHPLSAENRDNKYPNYSIISVDGIEEVVEKRQKGDILYITDDSKITSGKNGHGQTR
jgi:hypothetical protein